MPETPAWCRAPFVARARLDTPIAPMTALATADGLAALLFDTDRHHAGDWSDVPLDDGNADLAATRDWLARYWAGEDPAVDGIRLDLHGSLFQRAVWQMLLRIPQGSTWTYGTVAARVGQGAVPRATGTAIGRNPVAVMVPCHRVIGADGSLTGYAGGLDLKEQLLRHEGALLV